MNDKLCFVQFIHPGGEHAPDDGQFKRWNTGAHRRKFLTSPGRYIAEGDLREGKIVFWGEWEPESRAVAAIREPLPDGPHWIYEPYFALPTSYRGLQNTDPFVFGEQFHYTGCLQHTRKGPTQLRHLTRGSVILFGSCLHRSFFVVDTVFVVADHIDHSLRNHDQQLHGHVSSTYEAATLAPWYGNTVERDKSHRLYNGATFEAPVEGMFSFFPCLPHDDDTRGFSRPTVRIPGAVTDTLNQGKKLNHAASSAEARRLWDEVVQQVTNQGLMLGVSAALPPNAS